jgi:hypothetical protein
MLPLDTRAGTGEAQTLTAQLVSEHLSDLVLADAIAHAIRAIPGVVEMGQGLFARAATYGPGKHIAGIVFQHSATGERSVEVHVVLEEASLIKALSDVSRPDAPSSTETTPMLQRITDHIRAVVSQTFEHLGLPTPSVVDVTLDDLR